MSDQKEVKRDDAVTASVLALVKRFQSDGKSNYSKIEVALAKGAWKTETPYVNYMKSRTEKTKAKTAAKALNVEPVDGKRGPLMQAEVMDADIRDVMDGIQALKVKDAVIVSKTTTYKVAAKKPKA